MFSSKNALPDRHTLERIAQAISVLDAILCQEWSSRYYSFQSHWAEGERLLQMRNGEGDEMHILFRNDGCTINGFAHEYTQIPAEALAQKLPAIFREFAFGEPIRSIGTTFCLWAAEGQDWQRIESHNTDDFLDILDGNPQRYKAWAEAYFEPGELPIDTIQRIYEGETLTKAMVLSLSEALEDWQQLCEDLEEIGYPYRF